MDHTLHLALLVLGVAAFFVVPAAVAVPVAVIVAGAAAGSFIAVTRAIRLPVKTGAESLTGQAGTVVEWDGGRGLVRHRSELWRAEGPMALAPRARVRIVSAEGTLLRVQREDAAEGRGT